MNLARIIGIIVCLGGCAEDRRLESSPGKAKKPAAELPSSGDAVDEVRGPVAGNPGWEGAAPGSSAGPAGPGWSQEPGNTGAAELPDQPDVVSGTTDNPCLALEATSYDEPGPWKVVAGKPPGGYRLWLPENLGEGGCRHPVIAWGNGTGVSDANIYQGFMRHWASYGFIVIGSNMPMTADGKHIGAGLDWVKKQGEPGGAFAGKVGDIHGTAGHSQGGLGAAAAAMADDSVRALVGAQGGPIDKGMKAPVLFIAGTNDIFNGLMDSGWVNNSSPTVKATLKGADHIGTPTTEINQRTDRGRQYLLATVAWFRCLLMDDAVACPLVMGENPEMCENPVWDSCERKNF